MSADQRKLVIKIHLYRMTAILFAIVGLLVFIMLYSRLAGGDFMQVLRNPLLALWLLLPFLPSSFLFLLTGKCEKKLMAMLEQSDKSS